jgi:hypothetical protein
MVTLSFHLGNKSNTPALYSLVSIYIDDKLKITSTGVFKGPLKQVTAQGREFDVYTKGLSVPEHFPIFKEMMFALNDRSFHVGVPKLPSGKRAVYQLTALIRTPGFSNEDRWELVQLNDNVTLQKKWTTRSRRRNSRQSSRIGYQVHLPSSSGTHAPARPAAGTPSAWQKSRGGKATHRLPFAAFW